MVNDTDVRVRRATTSSGRTGLPRPPRRRGYRWWHYAILAVVAVAAIGLAYAALSVEKDVPGADTSVSITG
jgi:hypothetical protein